MDPEFPQRDGLAFVVLVLFVHGDQGDGALGKHVEAMFIGVQHRPRCRQRDCFPRPGAGADACRDGDLKRARG